MSLSNFRKVCDFNTSFGLAHYDSPQQTIFTDNPKLTKLRVDLCKEEAEELTEAVQTNNLTEIIDALTDELYVIYGAASSFGVDMDKIFKKKLVILFYETKYKNRMNDSMKEMSCDKIIEKSGLLDRTILEMSNYALVRKIVVGRCDMFTEQQCCNLNYNDIVGTYRHGEKQNQEYSVYAALHSKISSDILALEKEKNENNFENVVECLSSLLFDTYKMGIFLGIELDWSFDVVHRSNMSKLCVSEEEAGVTVEHYRNNDTRYKTPSYRKSVNEKYWVVFNQDTGKILKSINYTPAEFSSCPVQIN